MHHYRLTRVSFHARIKNVELPEAADEDALDFEWRANIPSIYRALTAPYGIHEFSRAPRAGDLHIRPAACYWGSLLHLLVCSFGWRYPGEGLRWWNDNNRPTDDPRFALIDQTFVADGQFDWFCAWLWTQNRTFGPGAEWGSSDRSFPPVHPKEWFDRLERTINESGVPSQYPGGDPLHLIGHVASPDNPVEVGDFTLLLEPNGEPRGVLLANTLIDWYWFLHQAPELAEPHPSGRSWRIEVVVRHVGSMGVYRRSRDTGRWFAGPHRLHMVGNPI